MSEIILLLILFIIASSFGLFFMIFAIKETKGKNQKKIWESYGIDVARSFFEYKSEELS